VQSKGHSIYDLLKPDLSFVNEERYRQGRAQCMANRGAFRQVTPIQFRQVSELPPQPMYPRRHQPRAEDPRRPLQDLTHNANPSSHNRSADKHEAYLDRGSYSPVDQLQHLRWEEEPGLHRPRGRLAQERWPGRWIR
jgi:hypothetical protein